MDSSNFSSSLNCPTYSNNSSTSAACAPPFKRPQRPLFISHGQVAFRFLCHASRVGGLIGKSGSIVKQLQQLTNSTIRVEDPPNSSVDYRVITIIGSPVVSNKIQAFVANELKGEGQVEIKEDGNEWFDVSAAQEGIFRVFERVVEIAAEGDAEAATSGVVSCRLLAGKSQVGAVIGKRGMIVDKIRRDTGCKIKVLVSEKLPSDPFPNEEIMEIEGDVLGVKKALIAVTGRLQDFPPPPERTRVNLSRPLEAESFPVPTVDLTLPLNPVLHPMASNSVTNSFGNKPSVLHSETETISNPEFTKRPQEVVFKILCPNERVGSIIGKGGSIIKTLESESGALISIGPVVAECNERLIIIRAMENVDSQYSPVQKAAVLIFSRCMEVSTLMGLDSHSQGSPVLARVVVPTNQVGCLLGKGGVIISEMRKMTGTGLKIVGGNQVPKCASENVQILEITGEFAHVRDALHRVVGRLRDNISTLQMSNGSSNRDSFRIEKSNYSRLRVPPALGSHQPFAALNNLNEQESLTRKMDNLGISNNIVHPPVLLAPDNLGISKNIVRPPLFLAPKPVSEANTGNVTDISRRFPSNKGGVELGRSAIVTNTTVEIAVPENIIGSIFGENGSNLARLRQISGAKVMVHEPRPGTSDRMVVISGSPYETQAAQSLLQAFIISGSI